MTRSQARDEFVPYLISWNVTQRCNLRCKHCYIDASNRASGELSAREALAVVDQIAAVNQESMLILTGGEPLLLADLDAIVERAASRGMMVVLGTNGTLLSEKRAHQLASAGLRAIGVSLDSLVRSRHDEFRGVDGAWQSALDGIDAGRAAGLEVQIQVTLTHDNVAELPQFVRYARALGARTLTVFFLVCTGRGQRLCDLTPEEYERILRQLATDRHEGILVRPRCAPTFRRVLAQSRPDSILLKSDAARCMAGKNYCRITPDGFVTPCPYMPAAAGNLREQAFGQIWHEAPLFADLRAPALQGRCGDCEYRELCGGCRARAYARTGDPFGEDPWCAHTPGTDEPLAASPDVEVEWTSGAEVKLKRAPVFVRRVIRSAVDDLARQRGARIVTTQLLDDAKNLMRRT